MLFFNERKTRQTPLQAIDFKGEKTDCSLRPSPDWEGIKTDEFFLEFFIINTLRPSPDWEGIKTIPLFNL